MWESCARASVGRPRQPDTTAILRQRVYWRVRARARAQKTHETLRAAARGDTSMLAPLTPTSRCYARVPRLG